MATLRQTDPCPCPRTAVPGPVTDRTGPDGCSCADLKRFPFSETGAGLKAARILAERGPEDRFDAFMMLAGLEYLWRMQGSELAALQVCALAVDGTGAATVLVRSSRTDAEGTVLYIAPDSLALVAELLERNGVADGRLFRSLSSGQLGEALDPNRISRIYDAMVRRAGIEADPAGGCSMLRRAAGDHPIHRPRAIFDRNHRPACRLEI